MIEDLISALKRADDLKLTNEETVAVIVSGLYKRVSIEDSIKYEKLDWFKEEAILSGIEYSPHYFIPIERLL